MKNSQQDALYRVTLILLMWRIWRTPNNTSKQQMEINSAFKGLIYYSYSALYVSGDVFAHHQEHLTVFTASDTIPK